VWVWTITFDLHDKSTLSKVAPSEVSLCFCFVCSQSEPHGGMKLCSETGYVSWVTVCQLLYGHVISKAWIAGFICYLFACLLSCAHYLACLKWFDAGRASACEKLEWWVLVWLSAWSELQTAYGPADATATHCLLFQLSPDWFYLSGTGSPVCVCVRACTCVCACVCAYPTMSAVPWHHDTE